MKKVTITSNDDSIIYVYTGSEDELKIDEDFNYFTVHFNDCSTSYRKGKYNIKVEFLGAKDD